LSDGWIEAGIDHRFGHHYISDTNSHLVTITLPGGGMVQFAATLTAYGNPLTGAGSAQLNFMPYTDNQGTLSCFGNAEPNSLGVSVSDMEDRDVVDWHGTNSLQLVTEAFP